MTIQYCMTHTPRPIEVVIVPVQQVHISGCFLLITSRIVLQMHSKFNSFLQGILIHVIPVYFTFMIVIH